VVDSLKALDPDGRLEKRTHALQQSTRRCEALWLLQAKAQALWQRRSAARGTPFERVSATVGLCFRETGFCGAETAASKRPVTFNRLSAETKPPHENPPIRRYLHDTRKSLFVWDCVVVPRGLHPPRSFFTGLRGEGDGGIAPDSGHSRDRQGAPGFDPRRTSHGQTQTSGSGGADLSFPIAAHPLPRISLADNARRDLRRQKMSVQERSSQTRAPSLQNCASGPPKNPYAMRRYRRRSRRGRTIRT
jgi:hypothetical protein